MTVALTDDQIRAFLDDLGLPQVDPAQFRASTLSELIRADIDLGRIRPILVTTSITTILYSTAAAVGPFQALVAPGPNQIIICRNLSIRFTNANTEIIRVQKLVGVPVTELWEDSAAPFASAPYIGTNNDASRAWGALGYNNIPVFGANPEFSDLQQQLQIQLESAGAADKFARITFDADFYEWEDWPGWNG